MLTAHRVRTSFVLGAAGATLIAALLLTGRSQPPLLAATASCSSAELRVCASLEARRLLVGTHEAHLAVSITAPARVAARPALSVAVVIDRSGSMSGEPIEHARQAATRLIDRLESYDTFTVITYSSSDEVVMPLSPATSENKATARAAIANIYDEGGTCISCGLVRAASELAPPFTARLSAAGLQRIVLISDGQANEGIRDRDELARLAARTAAAGVSITTVGVGLDFDERTMQRLADVGHGNYYFVEDTATLAAMFDRELGGLTNTVASNVRLVLRGAPGVQIVDAVGYPIDNAPDGSVVVPIADLRAGETRKVVLRTTLAAGSTGRLDVAQVDVQWRRVRDQQPRNASVDVQADVVDDASVIADSVEPWAMQAIEEALSGRALEEATLVYERHGYDAAKQVLRERVDAVRANKHVTTPTLERIEAAAAEAESGFQSAPAAKATKVSRDQAYQLVH